MIDFACYYFQIEKIHSCFFKKGLHFNCVFLKALKYDLELRYIVCCSLVKCWNHYKKRFKKIILILEHWFLSWMCDYQWVVWLFSGVTRGFDKQYKKKII